MELSKIQIPKHESDNWVPWKYRMSALLRGIDGLMDIVEGHTLKPVKDGDESASALTEYKEKLKKYTKFESLALLLITNNVSDETLNKVMRFSTPKEVWDELHRLYDFASDDQTYDLCLEFFAYKKDVTDDMGTHISKLKNLWFKMKQEMLKADDGAQELPELLLICKILDTLPEEYFSFKSSWLLMSKKDKTVENITSQLCAHERALTSKNGGTSAEALYVKTKKKVSGKWKDKNQGTNCDL